MLSILVPIYNYDVGDFVRGLQRQCTASGSAFEILCLDDASEARFRTVNRTVGSLSGVTYRELPENIGRSRIRNRLAREARYGNLLFTDCDSQIVSDGYISSYLARAGEGCVVYGGRCYAPSPPQDGRQLLHWLYGMKREAVPAARRTGYRSFMTNNVMMPREVFLQCGLDERLEGYGHEDTLLGKKLEDLGVPIVHIDNALCHAGLENAADFLAKTREGIANLLRLRAMGMSDDGVKLLRQYNRIRGLGLTFPVGLAYAAVKSRVLKNLLSDKPGLVMFDVYKLGEMVGRQWQPA